MGRSGHCWRPEIEANLLDTIAGVDSFICPTTPVAMGGAICMLFDRGVVGRSRTWAYSFVINTFFCKTQNIFAPKNYHVFFFGSGRFRDTPGGLITRTLHFETQKGGFGILS